MAWDLYSQIRRMLRSVSKCQGWHLICSDHSIRTITALETLTSIHSNIWYVANDLFEMKRLVWYTTHICIYTHIYIYIYIYIFPTPPTSRQGIHLYTYIYTYTPVPAEWGIRICGRIKIRLFKLKSCHYSKELYWSAGMSTPAPPTSAENEDLRFGQAYFQHASALI